MDAVLRFRGVFSTKLSEWASGELREPLVSKLTGEWQSWRDLA